VRVLHRVAHGGEQIEALINQDRASFTKMAYDLYDSVLPTLQAIEAAALLLQVAHPSVAAGVAQHSSYREDPWGRLARAPDHLGGVGALAREAVRHLARELLPELLHKALVDRVVFRHQHPWARAIPMDHPDSGYCLPARSCVVRRVRLGV